jgi:hypothetical protein
MSTTPFSVVPIFATPFGVLPLPAAETLNPVLAKLFEARAAADSGGAAHASKSLCYRSRDDLFDSTDEPVQLASGELLRGVLSVVAAVNDFTDVQLQALTMQARGWFTIVKPDGHVPATNYPLTAWCGIYCVAAPEHSAARRDSGMLRLYESRLGTMFHDATNAVMRLPFRPGHYGWRPVPGQLAVFPASLTHEIALLKCPGQLVLVTVRVRFLAPGQQDLPSW